MTTKLIVLAAVCVSFLAGLVIGRNSGGRAVAPGAGGRPDGPPVAERHPATTRFVRPDGPGPGGPGGPGGGGDRMRGWISEQLKLTPEQSQQMKSIWEETLRGGMRANEERRRELRRQRDEGIKALIPAGDAPKYDAVLQAYADGNDQLERDMRASFESAVKQTKEMLNDEQRARYEQILERTRPPGRDGPGAPGGRDRDRGGRYEHNEGIELNDSATRPSATTRPG